LTVPIADQIANAIVEISKLQNLKPVSVIVMVSSAKTIVRKTMEGSVPIEISMMKAMINVTNENTDPIKCGVLIQGK